MRLPRLMRFFQSHSQPQIEDGPLTALLGLKSSSCPHLSRARPGRIAASERIAPILAASYLATSCRNTGLNGEVGLWPSEPIARSRVFLLPKYRPITAHPA